MTPGLVHLKRGKERKVHNFYPWIQRGECRAEGIEDGSVARLVDFEGKFLAVGTYNAKSRFQFRVCSLKDEPLDQGFFEARFRQAAELRRQLVSGTDSWRLVHSEADGLPGLIIDQYGDWLIVQVRSLGMENLKDQWLPALEKVIQPRGIFERSEMAGREEEGLTPRSGVLSGEQPSDVVVHEGGLNFAVPVVDGLKTGFYLDQRETRRRFADRVKPGDKVLDCFCYTGAFTLNAVKSGAVAIGVDIHKGALEIARENARRNGLEAVFVEANAFEYIETDVMGPYDWIILDPPAIAKTAASRDSLKWGIWKLVKASIPQLKPGGRLIVCSCSYQLGLQELIEVSRLAASDCGVRLFLDDITFQDDDHPAPIHFPEALYLKCAWLRRV